MSSGQHLYYSLGLDVDIVPLNDGNVLFRSDTIAIRVEGELARTLTGRVLPLLDGQRDFAEVTTHLPDLPADALRDQLDTLVRAQVLRVSRSPLAVDRLADDPLGPMLRMLEVTGVSSDEGRKLLKQQRVAIVGLEGPGAYLAHLLAQSGIGTLHLLDPYPIHPGELFLHPWHPRLEHDVVARQAAVRDSLQAAGSGVQIITSASPAITRDEVDDAVQQATFVAGCYDRGFVSANYWINAASLVHRVPAVFVELKAHTALVGPVVIADETACYMCYRMRAIACVDEFNEAMSYEEFLDGRKRAELFRRAVLPSNPAYAASIAAAEILKAVLGLGSPDLASKVLEFDALTLESQTHWILQKPDCPVCGKKKLTRTLPDLLSLGDSRSTAGNIIAARQRLVSPRTGIVRSLRPVQKDVSEPWLPLVFRADVANHQFLDDDETSNRVSSGKGNTAEGAMASALGEAVERYSGAVWSVDELVLATRATLDGPSLDPRRLVLYAPDQYPHLKYAPYDDENRMAWVQARSLVTGQMIWVPALAVYMHYPVQFPEEFLFPITSNGLAAGPTLYDAVVGGLMEVLERDAFMITWLNALTCQQVPVESHPDPMVLELWEAYRRRGVDLQLFFLPTDHPVAVFAAVALQKAGNGPAAVVGLGASLRPDVAARKAILEVAQVRPALRKRMRMEDVKQRAAELLTDPHRVSELEDHDLLYTNLEALPALDFLLQSPVMEIAWTPPEGADADRPLETLMGFFRDAGQELLYYNLTPPDMETLNLYTARVIVPDFQPIDFGWRERRLGGQRLYQLPQKLSLRPTAARREELNDAPHPIS